MLPLLLFLLSGCGVLILGGAAAGTVGYVSGDLKATLNGGFQDVVQATDRAINDNSITQVAREESPYDVVYELRTLQDDKIQLTVSRATRDLTNVTIRVGVFGDEPLSHHVLHEIETRLK
ncbi:MAG: DUF3568 family protein [Desulfofustis sp.]